MISFQPLLAGPQGNACPPAVLLALCVRVYEFNSRQSVASCHFVCFMGKMLGQRHVALVAFVMSGREQAWRCILDLEMHSSRESGKG